MASSVLATGHQEPSLHASAATGLGTRDLEAPAVAVGRVPWFLYAVLFASTCVIVGVIWDISWHRTIGRDTFWTSAHLAIYLGGIVAGLTCGWLALRATFGRDVEASAATVRFWGFRAPFGAWVCIWGAFAMLTSAPFDDWWHNAYGLDVKILSPPHALLAAGIAAIQCGAMLMALAWQNRSVASRRRLGQLFLFGAGLLLILAGILASEYLDRWHMHRSLFYEVSAGVFPFFLVSAGRASIARWPATMTTLVYAGVMWVMLVVLPLFHGQPLLGPIYVHLDRFMPPDFPLLLFVPAVCIDLAMRRVRDHDWRLSLIVGVVFVAAFLAAQWPFADFLMSPWARNWIFATNRLPYQADLTAQQQWHVLQPADALRVGIPIAVVLACLSTRLGLWWGNWMSRIQR
jgi:hypothetical protein